MPFMHILKLDDGKWHVPNDNQKLTYCGKGVRNVTDQIRIGSIQDGPNPDKKDLCHVCFPSERGIPFYGDGY